MINSPAKSSSDDETDQTERQTENLGSQGSNTAHHSSPTKNKNLLFMHIARDAISRDPLKQRKAATKIAHFTSDEKREYESIVGKLRTFSK